MNSKTSKTPPDSNRVTASSKTSHLGISSSNTTYCQKLISYFLCFLSYSSIAKFNQISILTFYKFYFCSIIFQLFILDTLTKIIIQTPKSSKCFTCLRAWNAGFFLGPKTSKILLAVKSIALSTWTFHWGLLDGISCTFIGFFSIFISFPPVSCCRISRFGSIWKNASRRVRNYWKRVRFDRSSLCKCNCFWKFIGKKVQIQSGNYWLFVGFSRVWVRGWAWKLRNGLRKLKSLCCES